MYQDNFKVSFLKSLWKSAPDKLTLLFPYVKSYIEGKGGEHLCPRPRQDETDIPGIPSPDWIKLTKSENARVCIVQDFWYEWLNGPIFLTF